MTLYVSKVITFQRLGAMPPSTFVKGLLVGTSLMAGTHAGKAVVRRMSATAFHHALDGVLLCSGVALIRSAAG